MVLGRLSMLMRRMGMAEVPGLMKIYNT